MTTIKRVVLASCAVLALGATAAGSAGAERTPRHQLEAAALAIPNAAGDHDRAVALRFDTARGHAVQITGTATTSVTCDGCTGDAVTLQVIYLRKGTTFVARNAAVAWAADCTGCSGSALSVQVVIARSAAGVSAANRALALNAGCVRCRTTAAAVQLVFVGAANRSLSAAAVAQLEALRDQLLTHLRSADATAPVRSNSVAGPAGRAVPVRDPSITAATARMQALVTADLHAASARHDIEVKRS
jgi:hypothetical protein